MSLSPSPGVHSTSLAGEASRRLAYSMGATLLLAGLALLALFSMARQRADLQAARDTQRHFASAINNLDQDWQTASIRHKAGIELSRMLEDRRSRWSGLTGYLTVQGEDNSFTRLAITDAQDRVLYQAGFDDGAALSSFAHGGVSSGWHFDSAGRALFRFYVQPIWLGQGDGMGHLVLFWPMNNGLLYRLAVPETDLTLSWRGEAIASSLGERGLATPDAVREDDAVTVRIHLVSEGAEASDAVLVARHYPSYPLSLQEVGIAVLIALAAIMAVLWLGIGNWVIATTRRVVGLGEAIGHFSADRRISDSLRQALAAAHGNRLDEIGVVARAVEELADTVVERDAEREVYEQRLEESEARVLEITSVLGDGVYVLDGNGLVTFFNTEAERLLGWPAGEIIGRNGHETFHYRMPDGTPIPTADCPVHKTIASGKSYRSLHDWLVRRDGSHIPVSIVSTPIMRDGRVMGSVAAFHDITARLEAERQLRESEQAHRTIIQTALDGFLVVDVAEGRILDANDASCELLGYSRGELLRLRITDIEARENPSEVHTHINEIVVSGRGRFESRHRRKDQRIIDVEVSARFLDIKGGVLIAFVRDISERKRAEEQVRQLAYYDTLTDLPNRRLLLDRMEQALFQARRHTRLTAVMFLDLDHFKQINDSLGHDAGDVLLKVVGARLLQCVRGGDTVCRQGGDEFVVLLTDIRHPEDAAMVAEKIVSALAVPVTVAGQDLRVTTSIGIALFPRDGLNAQDLMKNADSAMYMAKEGGRNAYRFYGGA